ncbi:MAG: YegS/Rv2252/BmrU family lipid kinase [Eubacteriales bacterium]
MKHIFIINPMAGKTDVSAKLIPEIQKMEGLDYEVVLTEYPCHGKELARKFAQEYKEKNENVRIYACGGDGTLNEVMEGAYGYSNVEIGCLPYGTGNDYVKNFGAASDFQNISRVVNGTSIDVDILETDEGIAAEICTVGFDANVGYNTRHYKKLPLCHGKMAYNLSVVECLLQPIGTHLKLNIDGEVFEDDYLMVCLANGTTYGGGYKSAPEADLCDGLIDIIIVNKVSRPYIAKIISKYADGSYQENCKVKPKFQHCITYLRGKNITIEGPKDFVSNLDGECKVQKKIHVKMVEKAMKFIVPEGLKYR